MNSKKVSKSTEPATFGNAGLSVVFPRPFKKIPILVSKWDDGNAKGWRAEIPDNYENWKTSRYEDINFEDLNFHFQHDIETHEQDQFVFYRKKDAVACARFVNGKYLNGKGKIWFC